MKARIASAQPQRLLLYGLDREQEEKTAKLAQTFSIEVRSVEDEDLDRQVGALVGFPGFDQNWREKDRPSPPESACMVMAGLTSKDVDRLLAGLNREEISIPLKAVVTAANQSWSFAQLMVELARERAAMSHRTSGK